MALATAPVIKDAVWQQVTDQFYKGEPR